ncbi:MAG: ATP-binding protein [Lentisphaeraceae bacterium]|nr:ATP-binding protein [Lentisphaeraceae bacterium]
MTDKYAELYIDVTASCIEAMFGIPMTLVNPEQRFEKASTFLPTQELTVNIPFSGAISGDYFMCLNEAEWSTYFETALGDGSLEMINSCVKELLNTIVGDAITVIQEDFPDLTFLSPRIYRGSIDYPDTMTMKSTFTGEGFSEVSIALSLNMMKQDIGLKLDEVFEEVAKEKAKVLKAETTVRSIMNNIKQGIFSLEADGSISPGCSKELTTLFCKELEDIEEKNFDKVCLPGICKNRPNEMAKWIEFVCSAPDVMDWEDIVHLAPFHEVKFEHEGKDLIYDFTYHKLTVDDSTSVMVIIEDITEQKLAEEKLKKAQSEYESNLELLNNVISLNNSELFSFLQECDTLLSDVDKISESKNIDSNTINHLFRSIHSLKGGASTLNFNELSESAHNVENYLELLRSQQDETESDHVIDEINSIKGELNNIYSIVNRFNIRKSSEDKNVQLMINDKSLEKIITEVMTLELDKPISKIQRDNILSSLTSLKTVPLSTCEPTIKNMVDKISEKLGKKTAIVFDKEYSLPHDIFHNLSNPLIHIIRNSLDHGIESPEDRQKAGKQAIATISITGEANDNNYIIKVADDGRGLQSDLIKQVAISKGLVQADDIENTNVTELIFHPGFSTKEEVTELSGRGVGLDTVKTTLEDLGGSINIDNKGGVGTTFVLTIPCQTSSIGAPK